MDYSSNTSTPTKDSRKRELNEPIVEPGPGHTPPEAATPDHGDDNGLKVGKFTQEERRILVQVVINDPNILSSFCHLMRKQSTHGSVAKKKSVIHVIAERFNELSAVKRTSEAVRHHLKIRRINELRGTGTQGSAKDNVMYEKLLEHRATECTELETCTRCLQLLRMRVQRGLAKCGLKDCEDCPDPQLPYVLDRFDTFEELNAIKHHNMRNPLTPSKSGSPRSVCTTPNATPKHKDLASSRASTPRLRANANRTTPLSLSTKVPPPVLDDSILRFQLPPSPNASLMLQTAQAVSNVSRARNLHFGADNEHSVLNSFLFEALDMAPQQRLTNLAFNLDANRTQPASQQHAMQYAGPTPSNLLCSFSEDDYFAELPTPLSCSASTDSQATSPNLSPQISPHFEPCSPQLSALFCGELSPMLGRSNKQNNWETSKFLANFLPLAPLPPPAPGTYENHGTPGKRCRIR